ncbi:TetR family transcriptional regulator [Kitasatospora kazusensis]|uniref:TetR family transcriptional regulator n=1 Tax=Kitasatospora kazusensis TaxID=407974 RepID=A0ABP5LBS5_9ACTN
MPPQERTARTRHLIIQAAAASFDHRGFAMTGLNEIAQLAGVSKGALYFHFGSKEQLAEAVMAESRDQLRRIVLASRTPETSAVQYLVDLSHGLAEQLDRDVVFRAGLRLTDEPGLDKERSPSPYPGWTKLVGRQLARAAAAQELSSHAVLHQATTLLVSATAGIEILSRQDRGWLSPQVTAGVWQALLPALMAPDHWERIRTTRRNEPPLPL